MLPGLWDFLSRSTLYFFNLICENMCMVNGFPVLKKKKNYAKKWNYLPFFFLNYISYCLLHKTELCLGHLYG